MIPTLPSISLTLGNSKCSNCCNSTKDVQKPNHLVVYMDVTNEFQHISPKSAKKYTERVDHITKKKVEEHLRHNLAIGLDDLPKEVAEDFKKSPLTVEKLRRIESIAIGVSHGIRLSSSTVVDRSSTDRYSDESNHEPYSPADPYVSRK